MGLIVGFSHSRSPPRSTSFKAGRVLRTLARPSYYDIINAMSAQQENDIKNRGGRPATGQGTPVLVRLQPDLLSWLDAERAKLDPQPTRPEMMRIYLEERRSRVIVRD